MCTKFLGAISCKLLCKVCINSVETHVSVLSFAQSETPSHPTLPMGERPSSSKGRDDIMRTLLAHEKKGPTPILPATGVPPSDDESSTSESEDETFKAKPATTVPAQGKSHGLLIQSSFSYRINIRIVYMMQLQIKII